MNPSCYLHTYDTSIKKGFSLQTPKKKGVILENKDHQVVSEASPLPGYSQESFDTVYQELLLHLRTLETLSSLDMVHDFLLEIRLSPSSSFAIYSLFQQIFSPSIYPLVVPIRHYVDTSEEKLLSAMKNFPPDQLIKIKMGSYPVQRAIALMKELSFYSQLHVDIGKKWSLEETLRFSDAFSAGRFVALEDPVGTLQDLWLFAERSPHPISLDHLLRLSSVEELLDVPNLVACEYKPTLDMHLLLDKKLLTKLRQRNIAYTFSSSYETDVGIACIARLGFHLQATLPFGIDTLSIFTKRLVQDPFAKDGDKLILSKKPQLIQNYAKSALPYC